MLTDDLTIGNPGVASHDVFDKSEAVTSPPPSKAPRYRGPIPPQTSPGATWDADKGYWVSAPSSGGKSGKWITHADLARFAALAPTKKDIAPKPRSGRTRNVTPARLERRIQRLLQTIKTSEQGNNGSARLTAAIRHLLTGYLLSVEDTYRWIIDVFNPRCTPPWSEREILHAIDSVKGKPDPMGRPDGYLLDETRPEKPPMTPPTDGTPATTLPGIRPEIVVDTDEHAVNDQAVAALARDTSLYQRGAELVRVVQAPAAKVRHLDRPGGPAIKPLSAATLREKLALVASFVKVVYGEETSFRKPAHPPEWSVLAVRDRGEWPGVRALEGVTDFPIVRPDGSVCATPGYDIATEVFVGGIGETIHVSECPTQEDAKRAADVLLEVVADFPFSDDSHKAAWIASLLTPLARFAFAGPAPLTLIEGNVPACGKGRLADAVSLILTGTKFATAQYSHDSAEMRKVITAAAIAGDRLLLLDNVSGHFGNDALDAVLTSSIWRGRVLGENREVVVPLRASWFCTANNITLVGDISRRILHILLQSQLENPEERSDFKHPDLSAWIIENRSQLLRAALTILSGFIRAGCPSQKLTPFGSFEGWNRVVRGAVVWAGQLDPLAKRGGLREDADAERAAVKVILDHWSVLDPKSAGVTTGEIIKVLEPKDPKETEKLTPAQQDIRDVIRSIIRKFDSQNLGYKFKKWRNRVLGSKRLIQLPKSKGYQRWTVETIPSQGGHGGRGGDVSTSSPFPEEASHSADDKITSASRVTETKSTTSTMSTPAEPMLPVRKGLDFELSVETVDCPK